MKPPPVNPQWKDYAAMVHGEARKRICHNPYLDYEELVSRGMVAFDHAVRTWKPGKGRFSTHLWWKIRDQMGRVQGCQHYYEPLDGDEAIQVADEGPGPFEQTAFRAALAGMSREALEVAVLILTVPWELVDWTLRCVRPTQGALRQYLRSLGWGHPQIDSAFAEIKSTLAEL